MRSLHIDALGSKKKVGPATSWRGAVKSVTCAFQSWLVLEEAQIDIPLDEARVHLFLARFIIFTIDY